MAIQQRVSTLERLVGEVAEQQIRTEKSLERLAERLGTFSDEMGTFSDEMSTFKDEMSTFKDDIRRDTNMLKAQLAKFSEDVRASFQASNAHADRIRSEMNQKWGELANKLGTIVEDIVAPNVRGVAARYFGVHELGFSAMYLQRRRLDEPGTQREFDVVAYTDTLFFLAEAKSTPRQAFAEGFVALLPEIPEYFPEAVGKELVPIFSALRVPEDVVTYLTRHGVYCMVLGGESMVLTNFDEVRALRRSGG